MKITYEEFQYWAARFLFWLLIFIAVHFIVQNDAIAFLISFAYGAITFRRSFKNQ